MASAKKRSTGISVSTKQTPTAISDSGKVKLGDYTPLFPPARRGSPAKINDGGRVKLGDYTPLFPAPRSK